MNLVDANMVVNYKLEEGIVNKKNLLYCFQVKRKYVPGEPMNKMLIGLSLQHLPFLGFLLSSVC